MKYLNSYNEGLFSGKKIDTGWLNRIKSEIESNADFSDVSLEKGEKSGLGESVLDCWILRLEYKGLSLPFKFELRVPYTGGGKIETKIKRVFSKPELKVSCLNYWSSISDSYEFSYNNIIQTVEWVYNREIDRVNTKENSKKRSDEFKENLPQYTLKDLLLNLEDILGESKIIYDSYPHPSWCVTFSPNSILNVHDLSDRVSCANFASDKLFEIMGELSHLNSSLESFDCRMEFSIVRELKLWIFSK